MKKSSTCLHCKDLFEYDTGQKTGKFCSRECTDKHKVLNRLERDFLRILEGLSVKRSSVRKFLVRVFGHQCWVCLLKKWNGQPIPLWVDHIDGNAGNEDLTNFRLICPNCDSQEPTFGGKNRGNGRKSRGLRMYG
jgi:5-methylcytosine-specific restriction endonuclease McrA